MTKEELEELEAIGKQVELDEIEEAKKREADLLRPHKTEVRHIKGNDEKSIFFDNKKDALNFLLSHNKYCDEKRVIAKETSQDDDGIYFIVLDKDAPFTRG